MPHQLLVRLDFKFKKTAARFAFQPARYTVSDTHTAQPIKKRDQCVLSIFDLRANHWLQGVHILQRIGKRATPRNVCSIARKG